MDNEPPASTRVRAVERALLESRRLSELGLLAAALTHDLNDILTVIRGSAGLLKASGLPEPFSSEVAAMDAAAQRAAEMLRRAFARGLEESSGVPAADVNAVVLEMEWTLRRVLRKSVGLTLALAPGLGRARASQAALERMILTLAANARDAMPDGGRLAIETSDAPGGDGSGRSLRLAVTDSGPGLAAEELACAFEPLPAASRPGAAGLGLFTVGLLAAECGGRARAFNAPGRGVTVEVLLPRA